MTVCYCASIRRELKISAMDSWGSENKEEKTWLKWS
jgi:hypothetical protein